LSARGGPASSIESAPSTEYSRIESAELLVVLGGPFIFLFFVAIGSLKYLIILRARCSRGPFMFKALLYNLALTVSKSKRILEVPGRFILVISATTVNNIEQFKFRAIPAKSP
jgi:hypothetical protein